MLCAIAASDAPRVRGLVQHTQRLPAQERRFTVTVSSVSESTVMYSSGRESPQPWQGHVRLSATVWDRSPALTEPPRGVRSPDRDRPLDEVARGARTWRRQFGHTVHDVLHVAVALPDHVAGRVAPVRQRVAVVHDGDHLDEAGLRPFSPDCD